MIIQVSILSPPGSVTAMLRARSKAMPLKAGPTFGDSGEKHCRSSTRADLCKGTFRQLPASKAREVLAVS